MLMLFSSFGKASDNSNLPNYKTTPAPPAPPPPICDFPLISSKIFPSPLQAVLKNLIVPFMKGGVRAMCIDIVTKFPHISVVFLTAIWFWFCNFGSFSRRLPH